MYLTFRWEKLIGIMMVMGTMFTGEGKGEKRKVEIQREKGKGNRSTHYVHCIVKPPIP